MQESGKDYQVNDCTPKFTLNLMPYTDNQGWVRILVKNNQQISLDFAGQLTKEMIATNFKFRDFGVSDNEVTMNTENSWYIENPTISVLIATNLPNGYPMQTMDPNLIDQNQVIANVFNGKTPTATQWSQNYNGGYVVFKGIIRTYGSWTKMWSGCSNKPYINIG